MTANAMFDLMQRRARLSDEERRDAAAYLLRLKLAWQSILISSVIINRKLRGVRHYRRCATWFTS